MKTYEVEVNVRHTMLMDVDDDLDPETEPWAFNDLVFDQFIDDDWDSVDIDITKVVR